MTGAVLAILAATAATVPVLASAPSPVPGVGSPATGGTREQWAADLAMVDAQVRTHHPEPFAINPESAWVAKLAELEQTLPGATPDEQLVRLASLVGLLDSHSGLFGPVHLYPVWTYRFADGWFVVRAEDPSLVGSRLVSIDGTLMHQVEAALRPLVPADNESGELLGMQDLLATVEFLHGLGIVRDTSTARFVFEQPDGTQVAADLAPVPGDGDWAAGLIGYLMGDATEAVARRASPVWTRLDRSTNTFLLSYNDYTPNDLGPALAAMTAALDDGSAERVVLDMRYLRGGNGSLAGPLIEALKTDGRIDRPGGLTVLIGRENASAGTVVAGEIDRGTQAVLVGEPTPARADNFLCQCIDIPLPIGGFVVSLPTAFLANGDTRDAVRPDIPFALTSADFFAGRDPALDLALTGTSPAPSS